MRFKKFHLSRQLDSSDCGPACLKMIFKYYGKNINIETIKKNINSSILGVSLLELSEAAEKFNFKTVNVRITFDQLLNASLPCILHWDQNHFVI